MSDQTSARELDLYAENTYALYGQFTAIIANIQRKIKRGTYDPTLAPRLWRYWYDTAARSYCQEFGCDLRTTFPSALRARLSEERAREEFTKIMAGEYSEVQS